MRTIIVVLFLIPYFLVSLPVMGVTALVSCGNKKRGDRMILRFVQFGFRAVSFLSGVKLCILGQEHVPAGEPVLYVGNHRGAFDIILTYARCPDLTGYIAKASLAKIPFLSWLMRRVHCLFINREDIRQSMQVILNAIEKIKSGISICIFPEGTRNKDSENPASVLPFKEGSFKIAVKTGCKIVPMAITGTSALLEDHRPWIRGGVVILEYAQPIDPMKLTKDEQKHIGEYCQNRISDMLKKHGGMYEKKTT